MPAPAHAFRKNLAALALIGAPLILVACDLIHGIESLQTVRYVLGKGAMAIFAFAPLALLHLLRGRADRAGIIGAALTMIGAMGGTSLFTFILLGHEMEAGLDPSVVSQIESVFRSVYQTAVWYPLPGLFFPLGLVTLGVALFVTRATTRLEASLIAVGGALFPAGRIPDAQAIELVSGVLMLLGMGSVGLRLLRASAAEWVALGLPPNEPATVATPTGSSFAASNRVAETIGR